jgi:hypothetical protein
MTKIMQTTQSGFMRVLTHFARGIDFDRRDTFHCTEWRPSRWPDTDASTRGL